MSKDDSKSDDSKSEDEDSTLAETGEFELAASGDSDSQATASRNDATVDFSSNGSIDASSSPSSVNRAAHHSGSQFGPYVLEEEIARGGMGVVYRAHHSGLNRSVALKMILAGNLASDEDVRRFYTEAEAAAKLDHSNIVPVFDVGECDGTHYFAMKLIEGGDLGARLKVLRSDLKLAIGVLEKVCRAVGHAHQRGVLHRDLKPANILLDEDCEPYVVDLGLARRVDSESDLTRTGAVVGTPSYMSPEQASGESDLTTATDIYSLGAILYEILSGQPPFRGKSPMETLFQVIHDSPSRPSASASTDRTLEMIALKCLEKSPSERYPTALALAEDLRRWQNGEPITIKGASVGSIAKTWLRQNFGNAAWILVVGSLAGLIAGIGVWTATVQREVNSSSEYVYGILNEHQPPFSFYGVPTPAWTKIPSLMLFVAAIAFLGFFTALLVRTKNTSADVAAGLMVGCIAAAGAFFFAFATMGASVVIRTDDSSFIAMLAIAAEGDTPVPVLEEYPELEGLDREAQVRVLRSKIDADQSALLSRGLLLAAIACFGIFVVAGVAETVIAGAALRRRSTLWKALAEYLLRATPYIALSVFVGVHFAILLIFGNHALVMDWWSAAMIAGLCLGVVAEFFRWPIWIRLVTGTASFVLLVGFFSSEFGLMPRVARARYDLNVSLAKAERFSDRESFQGNAANAFLTLGVALYNSDRIGAAEIDFRRAIDFIEQNPMKRRGTQLGSINAVAHSNLAYSIWSQGREAETIQLLQAAVASHADNEHLGASAVTFFQRKKRTPLADDLIDSQVIDGPLALRSLKRMIYAKETFDLVSGEDLSAAKDRAGKRLLQRLKEAPVALQTRLNNLPILQSWQLIHPRNRNELAQFERFIVSQWKPSEKRAEIDTSATLVERSSDEIATSARGGASRPSLVLNVVTPFEPMLLDLTLEFSEAGINTAAFALAVVESNRDMPVTFHLGSDDGFGFWLNGSQLASYKKSRSFLSRQNAFSGQLLTGSNYLLLRVNQSSGPWSFALSIEESDGWPARIRWVDPADWESSPVEQWNE
ncbi:MAG: protein kinase domain-containing protein [Aureliella sp.]